jgi:Family of unknown function (DUF5908)
MPIEIKELVIKATIALDCENKTATQVPENIICLRLPNEKGIKTYVNEYFNRHKAKTLMFDQQQLAAFIIEWQASLLN